MDDLGLFVGRYRLIRQLGAGGMGVVYEAEDQLLNKVVAIKTIKRGFTGEHIMRFDREAKALAALNHTNLVALYIFGVNEDNEPYMVMRMESGTPLSEIIERDRLPPEKALVIFKDICKAMQHAHDRQVFHRDLKPSNLLVRDLESASPTAVIIDFGVAMVDAGNAIDYLTKTGMMVGTPAYMSPEQVRGQEVDGRSDVYSLGCIMFETLTGVKPFIAASALEVLAKKISKDAPTLNSVVTGRRFSKKLEAIIAKCLAQSAGDRYASMQEVEAELNALEDLYEQASAPVSAEDAIAKKKKWQLFALAGTAVAVPILIIFSIFLWDPPASQTHVGKAPTEELEKPIMSGPQIDEREREHCFLRGDIRPHSQMTYDNKIVKLTETAQDASALALVEKYKPVDRLQFLDVPVSGAFLAKCKNLPVARLSFKNCSVDSDGLKGISMLPNVQSLEIVNNKVVIPPAGLKVLRNATSLKKLTLQGCDLELEHIAEIAKLNQLEELDLSTNARIDDTSMPMLSKMPNLTTLVLDYSHVFGSDLKKYMPQFKHLTSLSLKGLIVSDHDLEPLTKMKLNSLNVEGTAVTQAGLRTLSKIKTMKHLTPAPDA